MKKITYIEIESLQNRGAVDPGPDTEVAGSLLVGEQRALQFETAESQYGNDYVEIFPAFHDGQRAWLRRDTWRPAHGYSASGIQEKILSFEDGVKFFLERGVFEFPLPESK